ncbi:MAG: hypothetical protein BGO67_10560 [Alphaproteobacteria bacterium 41-28]|nr:MAG: hypothetical protein BGO67_10560 [Alphaproteobacteria bacterium 41-28]
MLRIIEPRSHELYQAEINALQYIFKFTQNFKTPEDEQAKATFIIAEDSKCGIYGGAILRKKPLDTFDEEIEAIFSAVHSHRKKIWNVHLCFYISDEMGLSSQEKTKVFDDFFYRLFIKLRTFGRQQKTNCLVLSLNEAGYFWTNTYFEWPYVFKVPLHNTLDDHFHGILSLKPAKDSNRRRRKRSPAPVSQTETVQTEEAPL